MCANGSGGFKYGALLRFLQELFLVSQYTRSPGAYRMQSHSMGTDSYADLTVAWAVFDLAPHRLPQGSLETMEQSLHAWPAQLVQAGCLPVPQQGIDGCHHHAICHDAERLIY